METRAITTDAKLNAAPLFLAVLFLAAMAATMDRAILPMLLQPIKEEFGLSDRMLGLLGGAPYGVCFALSSLPLGRLADRYGYKRMLSAAISGWTAMTAFCGLAASLPLLFLGRMGVGLAEGGAFPPCHALIARYAPPKRRAAAFAIIPSSGVFGLVVAAMAGGWIAQRYGWRMAFLGMAALSALIALLVILVLREPPRTGTQAQPDLRADLSALFAKRSFVLILAGMMLCQILTAGISGFTPTYMIRVLHLDLAEAGRLFGLSSALGTVIGAFGGGILCDRLRRRDERWLLRLPALWALLAPVAVFLAFSFDNLAGFLALNAAIFLCVCALQSAVFATIQHVCGHTRRATASAVMLIATYAIGATLASLLTGTLSDLLGSLRHALLASGVAVLPMPVLFLRAARHLQADQEN